MSEDYYSIIEQSKLKECKNVRRLKKGMSIRMKICIINGSPKGGKSNSELLIEYVMPQLKEQTIEIYNISRKQLTEEQYDSIQNCDALIFVFPLYIDSIPAHLLRFLIELEKRTFNNENTMVYCMLNNGFFEGKQNAVAIEQVRLWCKAVGLKWGQGIGIGAGEMQPFLKSIPLGHGPNKNVGRAIMELSGNVLGRRSGENILVSPNWPRLCWRIQSSTLVWYPRAKANGLSKKEMYQRRI